MHETDSVVTNEPSVISSRRIEPDGWYTTRSVSHLLTCHRRSIQRAHQSGQLRGAEINSRRDLRFKGSWILDWLEERAAR